MKSLNTLLALGVCAGLTGCSTLSKLNPVNYFHRDKVVQEEIKPIYIDVLTTTGDTFTYEISGGQPMLDKLKVMTYQIGVERGIVKEEKLDVYDVNNASFIATYLALMDTDRDMVITSNEFGLGKKKIYEELDANRANLTDRVKGDLNRGRTDVDSVSSKTRVPSRIMPIKAK